MRKGMIAGLLIFLFTGLLQAQFRREPPLKLKFVPASSAKAGEMIQTKVEVEINKGFHIFSEKPEIEGVKPSLLLLEESKAFTVDKIEFPKPVEVYSDVFQKKLNFYRDKVSITVFLKLNAGISSEIPVNGTLQFQACSDKLCLPPSKQPFSGEQVVIE